MAVKVGLLSAIKKDVEKTGSSRGKFFYVKSGAKARIRFLEDMDNGRVVHMHDRWDPQLKVPCEKNRDEDAECRYCGVEGVRNRDTYAWSVWDYDANEVKIFMYPANQCTPVPGLVALYETYGTIIDRDFSVSRSGNGTATSYSLIPLDKTKFRNENAKPFTDKLFWKAINDGYPAPDGEKAEVEDDEDEKPAKVKPAPDKTEKVLADAEETSYEDMTPKELYSLCKVRDILVKTQMEAEYYIKKLEKYDLEHGDDEFWGDDE